MINIKKFLHNESPGLLAAAGVVGFVTAVVVTSRVAPIAHKKLDEHREAPLLDKVKAIAPYYAPVAGLVMISTGCIIASNRVNSARYGALLALYSFGEGRLKDLEEAVLQEVGAKKAEAIRERTVDPGELPVESLITGEGSVIICDRYTGRYFRARSIENVRSAVNDINELMLGEDFATLNEFYQRLGLDQVEFGDLVGWSSSRGLLEVAFDSFLKGDAPVVSMSFRLEPKKYRAN